MINDRSGKSSNTNTPSLQNPLKDCVEKCREFSINEHILGVKNEKAGRLKEAITHYTNAINAIENLQFLHLGNRSREDEKRLILFQQSLLSIQNTLHSRKATVSASSHGLFSKQNEFETLEKHYQELEKKEQVKANRKSELLNKHLIFLEFKKESLGYYVEYFKRFVNHYVQALVNCSIKLDADKLSVEFRKIINENRTAVQPDFTNVALQHQLEQKSNDLNIQQNDLVAKRILLQKTCIETLREYAALSHQFRYQISEDRNCRDQIALLRAHERQFKLKAQEYAHGFAKVDLALGALEDQEKSLKNAGNIWLTPKGLEAMHGLNQIRQVGLTQQNREMGIRKSAYNYLRLVNRALENFGRLYHQIETLERHPQY